MLCVSTPGLMQTWRCHQLAVRATGGDGLSYLNCNRQSGWLSTTVLCSRRCRHCRPRLRPRVISQVGPDFMKKDHLRRFLTPTTCSRTTLATLDEPKAYKEFLQR